MLKYVLIIFIRIMFISMTGFISNAISFCETFCDTPYECLEGQISAKGSTERTVPYEETSPFHISSRIQPRDDNATEDSESDLFKADFKMLYMYGIIGCLCLIIICQTVVIVVLIRKTRRTAKIKHISTSRDVHRPSRRIKSTQGKAALRKSDLPQPDAHYTGISQRQKEDNEHTYAELS